MDEIYQLVGRNIRQLRTHLSITQEKLAELSGLSTAFIGQIERGHNKASLATIQKIAEALQISIGELFAGAPLAPKSSDTFSNKMEVLLKNCSSKSKQDLERIIELFLKGRK